MAGYFILLEGIGWVIWQALRENGTNMDHLAFCDSLQFADVFSTWPELDVVGCVWPPGGGGTNPGLCWVCM